jgi:hypothetical protein
MKTLARFVALLTAVLTPTLAFAQNVIGGIGGGGWFLGIGGGGGFGAVGVGCGFNTVCVVAAQIIWIINFVLVPLIFAVAFIVFLWGVFKAYIWKHGVEQVESGHQLILWGVVGFVVMISIWGLVNVVSNTFGLSGIGAPPPPTSYPAY